MKTRNMMTTAIAVLLGGLLAVTNAQAQAAPAACRVNVGPGTKNSCDAPDLTVPNNGRFKVYAQSYRLSGTVPDTNSPMPATVRIKYPDGSLFRGASSISGPLTLDLTNKTGKTITIKATISTDNTNGSSTRALYISLTPVF